MASSIEIAAAQVAEWIRARLTMYSLVQIFGQLTVTVVGEGRFSCATKLSSCGKIRCFRDINALNQIHFVNHFRTPLYPNISWNVYSYNLSTWNWDAPMVSWSLESNPRPATT